MKTTTNTTNGPRRQRRARSVARTVIITERQNHVTGDHVVAGDDLLCGLCGEWFITTETRFDLLPQQLYVCSDCAMKPEQIADRLTQKIKFHRKEIKLLEPFA